MNDERFFDLAMKAIARQSTDAERAELDALLSREPELRAEFARLQADARMTKDALPLVDATHATAGELPSYARGRLQTKVRQTLGRPEASEKPNRELSMMLKWRWLLGLATATAVILLVALPMFRATNEPVIQLAMLDTAGGTRGTDSNEAALLRETWKDVALDSFTNAEALREWETKGKSNSIKIIYDRAAGEVRVLGRWKDIPLEKTFLVERDLATTLRQAKEFIQTETKR